MVSVPCTGTSLCSDRDLCCVDQFASAYVGMSSAVLSVDCVAVVYRRVVRCCCCAVWVQAATTTRAETAELSMSKLRADLVRLDSALARVHPVCHTHVHLHTLACARSVSRLTRACVLAVLALCVLTAGV
jgi:hypothetical protein